MGQVSVNPISYQEILAWKELTGSPLDGIEITAIKKVDEIYLKVSNDSR